MTIQQATKSTTERDRASGVAVDSSESADVYMAAYKRVLPAAQALSEDELAHRHVDCVFAVGATLGKLPTLLTLRPRMAQLPAQEFDLGEIDAYYDRTRALRQAEADLQMAVAPIAPVTELLGECRDDQQKLFAQAQLLVAHEIVPAAPVDALRQNGGHRNVATNNLSLISLTRKHKEQAGPLAVLSDRVLDEMAGRAAQLDEAVSEREAQPRRIAEAERIRHRMYTLFMRSYYAAERAVLFLEPARVDEFLPKIFEKQRSKRQAPVLAAAPEAPSSALAGGLAPAGDASEVEPGMPGSSPFLTRDRA